MSETQKAIFLDRDGTINVEKQYLHSWEDFAFLPGVVEGLTLLQQLGYLLIVVTNQSGIARGYYTEKDCQILNHKMCAQLKGFHVSVQAVYYCPHLPDAKIPEYRKICHCRKPALGMYEQAVKDFGICLAESYAIGDRMRDCAICKTTGCRGFLIGQTESAQVRENVKKGIVPNVEYAQNLLECAHFIEAEQLVKGC